MRLTGRVKGHPLAPGTYELRVRARNPQAASGLQRLRLIVLPRR